MESREELVNQIEEARKRLNGSIDGKESVSYTHLTLPTTPYV